MSTAVTPADAAATSLKVGLILQHIKNNNVAYLLGVLIAHTLGLLEPVITYGQGICV